MSETIWTTTNPPDFSGLSADTVIWDDRGANFKMRDIITLEAKTRVNSVTFTSKDIESIKEVVKDKLYKQLLQQLMVSGCVTIESVKNPINQSVTFTARVELLQPKATANETAKAA